MKALSPLWDQHGSRTPVRKERHLRRPHSGEGRDFLLGVLVQAPGHLPGLRQLLHQVPEELLRNVLGQIQRWVFLKQLCESSVSDTWADREHHLQNPENYN